MAARNTLVTRIFPTASNRYPTCPMVFQQVFNGWKELETSNGNCQQISNRPPSVRHKYSPFCHNCWKRWMDCQRIPRQRQQRSNALGLHTCLQVSRHLSQGSPWCIQGLVWAHYSTMYIVEWPLHLLERLQTVRVFSQRELGARLRDQTTAEMSI